MPELLDEVKDRHEKLQEQGLPDAEVPNQPRTVLTTMTGTGSINESSDSQEAIQ